MNLSDSGIKLKERIRNNASRVLDFLSSFWLLASLFMLFVMAYILETGGIRYAGAVGYAIALLQTAVLFANTWKTTSNVSLYLGMITVAAFVLVAFADPVKSWLIPGQALAARDRLELSAIMFLIPVLIRAFVNLIFGSDDMTFLVSVIAAAIVSSVIVLGMDDYEHFTFAVTAMTLIASMFFMEKIAPRYYDIHLKKGSRAKKILIGIGIVAVHIVFILTCTKIGVMNKDMNEEGNDEHVNGNQGNNDPPIIPEEEGHDEVDANAQNPPFYPASRRNTFQDNNPGDDN